MRMNEHSEFHVASQANFALPERLAQQPSIYVNKLIPDSKLIVLTSMLLLVALLSRTCQAVSPHVCASAEAECQMA